MCFRPFLRPSRKRSAREPVACREDWGEANASIALRKFVWVFPWQFFKQWVEDINIISKYIKHKHDFALNFLSVDPDAATICSNFSSLRHSKSDMREPSLAKEFKTFRHCPRSKKILSYGANKQTKTNLLQEVSVVLCMFFILPVRGSTTLSLASERQRKVYFLNRRRAQIQTRSKKGTPVARKWFWSMWRESGFPHLPLAILKVMASVLDGPRL